MLFNFHISPTILGRDWNWTSETVWRLAKFDFEFFIAARLFNILAPTERSTRVRSEWWSECSFRLESARNGHCAAAVNSEGSSPSARPSLFYLSHRQKAAAATSNNQVIGGNLPPDTDHYGKGEIEVVGWPNGMAGQSLFHSTEMPGKGKECGRTSRLEQHTL